MSTYIKVECQDQELAIVNTPVIASGGINENFMEFNFCPKWDGFSKTAVFYRNIKEVYHSVLDKNNVCEIPHEVTDFEGIMYFGVFGVSGETQKTSNILKYKIKQGAISTELLPSEPSEDIYLQILIQYNANQQMMAELEEEVETASNIAKGRNRARVFSTTEAMNAWLRDATNKGVALVGDNLYIVELNVPDWWIAEVLDSPNASGMYYEIAQLETQKVDLTTIEEAIAQLESSVGTANDNIEEISGRVSAVETGKASKSDLNNYVPKSGGTVNGNLTANRYMSDKNSAVGVNKEAFNLAPFVSNASANTDETMRAGYGFHNAGKNGSFLYLDIDGRLRTIDNMGTALTLANTADVEAVKGAFTLSGDTLTINMDALG